MNNQEYNNTKLSDLSLKAFEGWRQHIHKAFNSISQTQMRAPLFISRSTLEQSEYLSNFPQHIMSARSQNGNKTQEMFLTPASCLHVYGEHEHTTVDQTLTVLIEGTCIRHEDGKWNPPYRLPAFTMLEYVVIGDEDQIDVLGNQLQTVIEKMFTSAQIPIDCVPATDAFFLGSNEGAKRMQQLKGLKKEFIVATPTGPLSLASLNLHEDYFGKRFTIDSHDKPAHSLCVAFGLERLAFHSLETWGTDITNWPAIFKYEQIL